MVNDAEAAAIAKALLSSAFQNLIGGEYWSLSEGEEELLWDVIGRLKAEAGIKDAPAKAIRSIMGAEGLKDLLGRKGG